MRLLRIDEAIQACEAHLCATSSTGTLIESLLTQSLLVIMCAEFETAIENIVSDKCNCVPEKEIRQFFASCVGAVFRSTKSSELSGLLNRFDPEIKRAFLALTDENQVAVTYFNNIVTNRHRAAHSSGSSITFRDAKEFYERGHVVLDMFRQALHGSLSG